VVVGKGRAPEVFSFVVVETFCVVVVMMVMVRVRI